MQDLSATMHEVDNNLYGLSDEDKSPPPKDSLLLDWPQLPSSYEQPTRFGRAGNDENTSIMEHEVANNIYGMEDENENSYNLYTMRASRVQQDLGEGQAVNTTENEYEYCHSGDRKDVVYEDPGPNYASIH